MVRRMVFPSRLTRQLPRLALYLLGATCLASCATASSSSAAAGAHPKPPPLVVMVVVDQLRADLLTRFSGDMLPAEGAEGVGGFRYLMERGAYFPFAEHRTLNPVTSSGHANLATGTWPNRHGIVLNAWYDAAKKRKIYAVEQPGIAHVGEVLKRPRDARGPKLMRAPTLGDALKDVSPRSRVIALSLKDRAAVPLAGRRADAAIWMGRRTKTWVTSQHYAKELPQWVRQANKSLIASGAKTHVWKSEGEFEHRFKRTDYMWVATPAANLALSELARRAVDHYRLGRDEHPDLLMVSLSSHDYTGHGFGVASPEVHALTLSDDATLARLFRHIDATVPGGMANTVVVVTGDHGVGAYPKEIDTSKTAAGYVDDRKLAARLDAAATKSLGAPPNGEKHWVSATRKLHIYLNPAALGNDEQKARLETVIIEAMRAEKSVFEVYLQSDLAAGRRPTGLLGDVLANSVVKGRSGDIIGIPQPYFLPSGSMAHHWTPWAYDRYVPLLMAGPGIRRVRVPTVVPTIAVAPTLAYLLGILPPAMAEGPILRDAIR